MDTDNIESSQPRTTFKIIDVASEDIAKAKAAEDLLNQGGSMMRGDLSKASGRWQFSSTTTVERLLELSSSVRVNKAAMRQGTSEETQRPIDEAHVKEIAAYFRDRVEYEMPYWFGQLAFNLPTSSTVTVYVVDVEASVRPAYMIVRPTVRLFPVDGNHRLAAFEMLYRVSFDGDPTWDGIREDCIQFCLIDEPDADTARQLFVDAAQAKPLPPSLLVSFSSLDLFPAFVKNVADSTPLFHHRIDRLSKSLGKDPRYILTMNQLRVVLAEFAFGAADRRTIEQMSKQFENQATRERYLHTAISFYEGFAKANDDTWHKLLQGDSVNLYDQRQNRVDFTTSGLQVISRIGHRLYFESPDMDTATRDGYITRLGQLSYARSADIWKGHLVKDDNRIGTQVADIVKAYRAACSAIGLQQTDVSAGSLFASSAG